METIAANMAIPGATPRASRLRPLRLPATQVYHRSGVLAEARLEAPEVEAVLESGENRTLCFNTADVFGPDLLESSNHGNRWHQFNVF